MWGNGMKSGWAYKGDFGDPRKKYKCTDYDPLPVNWVERGFGPMPKEYGRYRGCYRNERRVILSYSVGDVAVVGYLVDNVDLGELLRSIASCATEGPQ